MVAVLVHLVIVLLIIGVIWWAITELLPLFPLPAPVARVIHVLMVVILAVVVIEYVLLPLLGNFRLP